MATQFAPATDRRSLPAVLFRPAEAPVRAASAKEAIDTAAVAERVLGGKRSTRCRLSYFLCEVANQMSQRGAFDVGDALPLSPTDISAATGISLCKVKRVLALLRLSDVVAPGETGLEVLDWQRLCAMGNVDPQRLNLAIVVAEEEDEDHRDEQKDAILTVSGEQACFV